MMARAPQSGRNRVDLGMNKPQAATFQAQRVPHVGAQRYGDKGAPYAQMAAALGRFNNALQGAGKSMFEYYETEKKYEEQQVALTGGLTEEGRVNYANQTGVQADATRAFYSQAQIEANVMPKLQRELKAEIEASNASGWLAPTEEGGVERQITEQEIEQEFFAANDQVYETYGKGKSNAAQRNALFAHNKARRDARINALREYNKTQLQITADDTVRKDTLRIASEATEVGLAGDDFTQTMIAAAEETYRNTKGSYQGTGPERSRVVQLVIEGFGQQIDNPAVARQFLEFYKGNVGGDSNTTIAEHPTYGPKALKYVKAAMETLDKDDFEQAKALHIQKIAQGLNEGKSFEVAGGGKDFTWTGRTGKEYSMSAEKVKEKLASTYDKAFDIQVPKGAETPENLMQVNRMKIKEFAGSGLQSPGIEAVFSDIGADLTSIQDNPEKGQIALAAYQDLKSLDPLSVKKYIKDARTRNLLEAVSDFVDQNPDMSMADAWAAVPGVLDEEGNPPNAFSAFGYKESTQRLAWQDAELDPTEIQEIKGRINIIAAVRGVSSYDEFDAVVKEQVAKYRSMRPEINGGRLRVPNNVDPAFYKDAVEDFIVRFVEKNKIPVSASKSWFWGFSSDLSVRSGDDGFYITLGDNVLRYKDKNGQYQNAFIPHAQVLAWKQAKSREKAASVLESKGFSPNGRDPKRESKALTDAQAEYERRQKLREDENITNPFRID